MAWTIIMDQLITILIYYVLPMILTIILHLGEPDEGEVMFGAIIPGLNIIGAGAGLLEIVRRSYKSKGRCIFRHKFEYISDEKEDMIMVRRGGFDEYICSRCGEKRSVKWSAF